MKKLIVLQIILILISTLCFCQVRELSKKEIKKIQEKILLENQSNYFSLKDSPVLIEIYHNYGPTPTIFESLYITMHSYKAENDTSNFFKIYNTVNIRRYSVMWNLKIFLDTTFVLTDEQNMIVDRFESDVLSGKKTDDYGGAVHSSITYNIYYRGVLRTYIRRNHYSLYEALINSKND